MQIRTLLAAATLGLTAQMIPGPPAGAAEPGRVWVSGSLEAEFHADFLFSRHSDKRSTDLYFESFPEFRFHLLRPLTLVWQPEIKQLGETEPGETRIFQDQYLYNNGLYLSFEQDLGGVGAARLLARAIGGKFRPAFGRAWSVAPGVYGDEFSLDYEYNERIGFGGEIEVDGGVLGHHVLQASVFFLDTSVLSNSWITSRGRRHLSDGGVSNTGRLNSFVLSWTSTRLPGIPGLEVQAALAYQTQGKDGDTAEIGGIGSLRYTRKVGPITLTPFLEVAYYGNADGVAGTSRVYVNAAIEAAWRGWSASILTLVRNGNGTGDDGGDERDLIFSVSAGYSFDFGLSAQIAYIYRKEDGNSGHGLGILVTYGCTFSLASAGSRFSCKGED